MIISQVKDTRDLATIARKVQAATGLKLMADTETDTVDGWIDGIEYKPGTSGACDFCGTAFKDGHRCIRISTYDHDEPPNEEHKSTLRKATITPANEKAILNIFTQVSPQR
jgi:hypothetical protein